MRGVYAMVIHSDRATSRLMLPQFEKKLQKGNKRVKGWWVLETILELRLETNKSMMSQTSIKKWKREHTLIESKIQKLYVGL